jgi:hypothetical protein
MDWSMTSKSAVVYLFLFGLMACKPQGKSEVSAILEINEPKNWILVIHPEGCKTCLDSFYEELMTLAPSTDGAIVILAKNSKTLRMNPLIQNSPIPLYLDEEKLLTHENLVKPTDQILLFKKGSVEKFDILDYQKVFQSMTSDR